jgi:hypothetical protein
VKIETSNMGKNAKHHGGAGALGLKECAIRHLPSIVSTLQPPR